MDFVTHTLVGGALASSVVMYAARKRAVEAARTEAKAAREAAGMPALEGPEPTPPVITWPPVRRERGEWTALLCGVLASNAPDIDVLCNPYKDGGEGLSYMLFHRGFTHTLLFCLAVGAALGLVFSLRSEKRRPTRGQLLTIGILGALSHLVMDATNDYGVHPFWPLWNGWIYGDFIFLAEPLIIGALLPLALRTFFRDYGGRGVNLAAIFALALVVVGFIWFVWHRSGAHLFITAVGATLSTIWVLAQVYVRASWPRLWAAPWVSIAAVWVVFFGCSAYVKSQARAFAAAGNDKLEDVVTTPAAGDPLCWRVIITSTSAGGQLIKARMGSYSLWPSLSSPKGCFEPLAPKSANLLDKPPPYAKPEGPWFWAGRFEGRRKDFDRWAAWNDRIKLTRRFLRAPFWQVEADGQVLLGDLRMDYEPRPDRYSKYRFVPDKNEPLEGWLPVPWLAPLLKEGGE